VCKECKEPYQADEESLTAYGHIPQGLGKCTFYKGKGCPTCNFTGMKGRIAIYEVMPITQEIRDLILRNAPSAEIREVARQQGMKTLRESGLMKVIEGTTTMEEVLRVTLG
jgi:type IV pilus assembly protein PilB